ASRAHSSASSAVHGFPSTRSRSSFPTLKKGTRLAWTATIAPVFGFRPSRARRCFTTKLPKPRISMRSPRVSAAVMLSKTAFTMTSASRREKRGNSFSTSSIRSRLVMLGSLGQDTAIEGDEPRDARRAPGALEERPVEQLDPPGTAVDARADDARLALLPGPRPRDPGRVVEASQLVDEPRGVRLRSREDAPVRQRADLVDVEPAPTRDRVDELAEHVVDHRLEERPLLGRERPERVSDVLEGAALHHLLADSDLLRERPVLGDLHDDAQRAGERPGVGDDHVGCRGDVVARRRRDRA